MGSEVLPRVNIDEPRWDQGTYWGRARHFFATTNPLNILVSSEGLDQAKIIVDKYRYSMFHTRFLCLLLYFVLLLNAIVYSLLRSKSVALPIELNAY